MLRAMEIIRNFARTVGTAGIAIAVVGLMLVGCSDEIEEAAQQQSVADSELQQDQNQDRVPQDVEQGEQSRQESAAQSVDESEQDGSQLTQQQSAQNQQSQHAQQSQAQQQDAQQQTADQAMVADTYLPLDATETPDGIPIVRDSERPQYFGLDWGTAWGIRIVDFAEISQGAGRDAIPAISGPLYVSILEASDYYTDNVPMVQVNVNGDARAFPLEILTWHEIVNDVIGGMPVTVTFCPLCNTAIAFESQIGEEVYKFGVSGLLRNSDLIMYDRNTESLWQQSSGRAIVGRMVGARLTYVPATVVTLGQLRFAYPDALVMSRDTGWARSYGQNPYRGYDNPENGGPYTFFFDRDSVDERLPPAERVVSIEGPSGAAIAYAWSALSAQGVLHDSFDGIDLVVFWTPGATSILDSGILRDGREVGTTAVFESSLDGRSLTFASNPDDEEGQTFVDAETGTIWDIFGRGIRGEFEGSQLTRVIHSDHFWFAWQAFHPDTEVVSLASVEGNAEDS